MNSEGRAILLAQRWTLRGAAVLLPLAFSPLTYDHYVIPKLLLARLAVLVLAALFIARSLSSGTVQVKRTPLELPLIFLIGSATLSTVLSMNANVSLFGTYSRYDGLLTLITYVALFWLAVQTLADVHDATALLRYLLAGGYLVAVVAAGQWFVETLAAHHEVRAYGTLGNPNVLGAYLTLLMPLAYAELLKAQTRVARVLAANVLVTLGIAALLTVSYSTWLGLAVAAFVLIAGRQLPAFRSRLWPLLIAVAAIATIVVVAPIALSRGTDLTQRLHIWQDSMALIWSRPFFGYGPDTFGLVYPAYQTGQWVLGYAQVDKAHSELLQIAATQGVVGVAAWLWTLVAFVLAFRRGRNHDTRAWFLLAGWLGYQAVLLVNFTALAAAFPLWLFVAAAMVLWSDARQLTFQPARTLRYAGIALLAGLVALTVPAVAASYIADVRLKDAVDADYAHQPPGVAEPASVQAHMLVPQESVYAVEVANIAFENGDWSAARIAYSEAAALGTFNPLVYRNLALADRRLGLRAEALTAARHAVYLDRFDPINQAVLAQMLAG